MTGCTGVVCLMLFHQDVVHDIILSEKYYIGPVLNYFETVDI
jgi:hypothetical protein